jgi:hypothetical protein
MKRETRTKVCGLAMFVAPGLMLAGHLVQSTPARHDTASELSSIAAHTGRADASVALGFLGLLVSVPALFGLARPLLDRGSRLAVVGLGLGVAGLLSLVALMGSSPVTAAMVSPVADRAQMVGLTDRYESAPIVTVWVVLMVLGWSLAPVVLGFALWRRAGRGLMVPVALSAGLGLAVADAGRWPLAAGFACTWVGMGIAGWRLVRGQRRSATSGARRSPSATEATAPRSAATAAPAKTVCTCTSPASTSAAVSVGSGSAATVS